MTIQWFPGHMAKARREVTEKLKYIDIVFELVDARLPLSSRNPMMDEIVQHKPRLVILNKGDLADHEETMKWQRYFKEEGHESIIINAKEGKGIKQITSVSQMLLKEKRERQVARGMKPQPIRAMIIGIPNVGKSTLMNRLVRKNIAKTGNRPGVTKGQQWLKVGNELELLDTPGILWPKFEDEEIGKKLALTGAIKDNLLHLDDIALYAIRFFNEYYPQQLQARYQLTDEQLAEDAVAQLMTITQKRGFRDDYERASEMIVQEIRNGQLGRLTLDRVENWEHEDE
ncbi:ribosome biogenesis GTPase YlqF [Vagococcus lutrae]|uniref:ribosome biogenesis GTPase YlqF n=1 Tax=Vagococcus lutrae TaxID=81947 RepID=UPI00200F7F8B|nr:ribosome biogenesis GTPase YlqF [Vagococcus lutrae]MDT2842551.1 ribosome biogenesis GTPase YlqF [Vagococcus lutrae]MDY3706545.1 ribosome biogenesis GTPase YlqF [Vagococcus lutrae]UQF11919.1 ribosome biogenesis GTPase YlqF [Vagococcus lutrae]UQF71125.1 ribosome biogenesis GTPase YlqF [Vagococcus lutrae]WEB82128.1 ribosome biogenesis GTPase YlqF [Vagococcus lutrae]